MLREDINLSNPKKKLILVSEENHFVKQKVVGQGTFGKVYLARDTRDNSIHAIKSVLQDKRYKNRELSIISKLDHPNIIKMKDYFFAIEGDEYYLNIVMDFVPDTLQRLLRDNRRAKLAVDPIQRKIMAFQLFKAMHYLKLNNVCHRDLKPPNILLNNDTFEVKICDFGSAKIIEKSEKNVSYICSRYYRSPELIFGRTDYGMQIDMWSMGCILVEFLTADAIFPGDSSLEQLIEIIKILGAPSEQYLKRCTDGSIVFPNLASSSWSEILEKYDAEEQLIDLIEKILIYDTDARITPYQALLHPYFKKLATYTESIERLPEIFNFKSLKTQQNDFEIEILEKIYVRLPIQKEYKGLSMISTFRAE